MPWDHWNTSLVVRALRLDRFYAHKIELKMISSICRLVTHIQRVNLVVNLPDRAHPKEPSDIMMRISIPSRTLFLVIPVHIKVSASLRQ